VKSLEAPKASSLVSEEVERLCEIAEESARKYVMSKVLWREVSDLDITVEAGGEENNLTVNVDVDIRLSPLLKDVDPKRLAEEAVEAAFESVEKFLRETRCHSRR